MCSEACVQGGCKEVSGGGHKERRASEAGHGRALGAGKLTCEASLSCPLSSISVFSLDCNAPLIVHYENARDGEFVAHTREESGKYVRVCSLLALASEPHTRKMGWCCPLASVVSLST